MPKKKKESPLTPEQQREIDLKHFLDKHMGLAPEPSYHFGIGDKVRLGHLEDVTVVNVINDKVYEVQFNSTSKDNPGIKTRFVMWHGIRPYPAQESESLIRNTDLRLSYFQQEIESLLYKVYEFGVDFDPEYQRELVWDNDDKEALIGSIFNNIDIGKFVFVHTEDFGAKYLYEILDGKQRLRTILDFYENKLSYMGHYYNDLCEKDQRHFRRFSIATAEVKESNRVQILKYFVVLNTHGRAMDKNQLKKVEQMIKEAE